VRSTRDVSFARNTCRRVHPPTSAPSEAPGHSALTALFGARVPSLFEARRRLPTSATLRSTCGQPNPSSRVLAGRRSRPPSFSDVSRLPPCGSGDTRRAALRPFVEPQCWFLPLAWVCPTVMLPRTPHHSADCSVGCIVRIDRHGSKDRAKDASPGRMHDLSCVRWVHALCGACRRRSPPRRPSDIRCHRRACSQRRIPLRADGPTEALLLTAPREEHSLPQGRDVFPRHDTRRSHAEGGIPPAFAPALSLTPPTRFPHGWGTCLMGIARVTVRSPAIRELESTDAFSTRWTLRAWD
jgi:hypothetical protein